MDHNLVEPFSSTTERADAIQALACEIATDLECGRKVECSVNTLDAGYIAWSNVVDACFEAELLDELQQFLSGTRSKASLCESIAAYYAADIYEFKLDRE